MSYYMHSTGANFLIRNEDKEAALAAVKALGNYPWVHPERLAAAETLKKALKLMGWTCDQAPSGDIYDILFEDNKSTGEEERLFGALLPFVKNGSYIEMQGEDGDEGRWRWTFLDGQLIETYATVRVVWPNPAEQLKKEA